MSLDKKKEILPRVQQRILSDVKELAKNADEFNENGIYWHIDESDIRKIWVVITGQEGTPYADAPFFFEFTFPDTYPLIPPAGKFCTTDGKTRFNPNLYVEGKICLSILGTWSGPSWTPVMTTRTILMSIIALVMTGEPIKNEPGWENASQIDINEYNQVVEYRSLKVGIIDQLNNCHQLWAPMFEQMLSRFKRDFQKIMVRIEKNKKELDGKDVKPRYGSAWKLDYTTLKNEMIELGRKHGLSFSPEPEIVIPPVLPLVEVEKKTKEQSPKNPATMYPIGHEEEINGQKFIVKENKSGKKYWRKIN